MSADRISVELDLDSGRFHGKMTNAGRALQIFDRQVSQADGSVRRIEKSVTGFGVKLRDAFVIMGQARFALRSVYDLTGRWAGAIIKANSELERQTALLGGLSKASDEAGRLTEAKKSMGDVLDFARKAPFSIREIGNSFVKMKSAGIDPMAGAVESLTNAVANFGGDDQIFHRATIAIQQMAGKGVISMEELRQQLGEAVPSAMALMARSMGVSVGSLVRDIAKGTVEAKSALDSLFIEMQVEFAGSAKRMMTTWSGLVSQLNTEWMVFAKVIGDAGFYEAAKDQLRGMLELLRSDEGRQFAESLGRGLTDVIVVLGKFARWLIENRQHVVDLGKAVAVVFGARLLIGFAAAAGGAAMSLGRVTTALAGVIRGGTMGAASLSSMFMILRTAAGPIGIAATAVAFLILKLIELRDEANNANEAWVNFQNAAAGEGPISGAGVDVAVSELEGLKQKMAEFAEVSKKLEGMGAGGARRATVSRQNSLGEELMGIAKRFGGEVETTEQALQILGNYAALLEGQINNQKRILTGSSSVEDARKWAGELGGTLDEVHRKIGDARAILYDKLKPDESNPAAQKTYVEESRKVVSREFGELILDLDAHKLKLTEALTADPDNVYAESWRVALNAVNVQMGKTLEERDKILESFGKIGPQNIAGAKDADGKKKADSLGQFYDTIRAKIAGMEAQLEDANIDLEKFNSLLKGGRKFGANPDAEMVAKVTTELERMAVVKKKLEADNAVNGANDFLRETQMRLTADLASLSAGASGNIYDSATAGMVGLNRQIAEQEAALVKANVPLEKFEAGWAALREQAAGIDASKFVAEVSRMTQDINTSLIQNPKDRADEVLRQEIERLNNSVAAFQGAESEKIRMATAAEGAILALRAQHAQETKTVWQKLLDNWRDTSDEMEQATANAIQGMSDMFMEFVKTGKLSFSSLVESILADILRMRMNKMFAEFLDVMISSFSGSIATPGAKSSGAAPPFAKSSSSMGLDPNKKSASAFSVPSSFAPSSTGGLTLSPSMGGAAGPPVMVNVINQTGQQVQAEQKGGPKFDGKQFVLDVVLTAMGRPGNFRDGMKGAM